MSTPDAMQRRFFMHSAHTTVGVSAVPFVWQADEDCAVPLAERPRDVPAVHLVAESPLAQFTGNCDVLIEYLRRAHGVECIRATVGAKRALAAWDRLEPLDCAVLLDDWAICDGDVTKRARDHLAQGGALVAVRTAGPALPLAPDLAADVFGGWCRGRYDDGTTEVRPADLPGSHPLLAGVRPFVSAGALRKVAELAHDVTVLLEGLSSGHREPVAWTRQRNGARVFFTSLGHPADFQQPDFLRLLAAAVLWTTRRRPR